MSHNEALTRLVELILDLGFDYDRLSTSGQGTYDEIIAILSTLNQ